MVGPSGPLHTVGAAPLEWGDMEGTPSAPAEKRNVSMHFAGGGALLHSSPAVFIS